MMQKILVVDDEPHILTLVENVLKAEKYIVITASNGKDCLALAEKERPTLILLDVMMSGMDGWEVCEKIKSNTSTKNIPVIMLTAKEKVMYYSVAKNAGADDYISKPFTIREIIETVKKYEQSKTINPDNRCNTVPGASKKHTGSVKQVSGSNPGIMPPESDPSESIHKNRINKKGAPSSHINIQSRFLMNSRFRI